MKHIPNTYYRLLIISAILSATACTGVADPLLPGLSLGSDSVLSSGQSGDANVSFAPECVEVAEPATNVHQALFDALNIYREENGLEPLIYSERLASVVEAHLEDTWTRGYFAHVNPEGQGPSDRALEAGFCHKYVGENLAAGQKSVDAVMEAWKNSPSHNNNMLKSKYVYVGMGYFVDPFGRQYWGQLLAYDMP